MGKRSEKRRKAEIDQMIIDHLILFGDPEVPRQSLPKELLQGQLGELPKANSPFCSWGRRCPIHPDGKGGPWLV